MGRKWWKVRFDILGRSICQPRYSELLAIEVGGGLVVLVISIAEHDGKVSVQQSTFDLGDPSVRIVKCAAFRCPTVLDGEEPVVVVEDHRMEQEVSILVKRFIDNDLATGTLRVPFRELIRDGVWIGRGSFGRDAVRSIVRCPLEIISFDREPGLFQHGPTGFKTLDEVLNVLICYLRNLYPLARGK